MKITAVHTFKFWVDWCNWLLVRVDTDQGQSGWGEESIHGSIEAVETAIRELSVYLIGNDPLGVEELTFKPQPVAHRTDSLWQ